MLDARVDDSNIHDRKTGKAVIVGHGGGVVTFDQWKLLEQEWKAAIDDVGVSCFHLIDFEKYQGEFRKDRG